MVVNMKADMNKNPNAVALGKLAKGIKKNFSPEDIARRTELLRVSRQKRWPQKTQEEPPQ